MSVPSDSPDFQAGEYARMWVQDGVLFVRYPPGLVIDMSVAEGIVLARENLLAGRTMPLLVDITGLDFVFTDARKFLNSNAGLRGVSVKAIYSRRQEPSLIARLSILFDAPPRKVRVFDDLSLALEWIGRVN